MSRFSKGRYTMQVMAIMAVYVVLMILVWPHVRDTTNTALKVVLAVTPVVPVACVVGLMARRILLSDELQQRVHLIALGVATALIGTASMVGGFLATAHVWNVDGSILFWVFPALCFVYGPTHLWLNHRYTGVWDWWGC